MELITNSYFRSLMTWKKIIITEYEEILLKKMFETNNTDTSLIDLVIDDIINKNMLNNIIGTIVISSNPIYDENVYMINIHDIKNNESRKIEISEGTCLPEPSIILFESRQINSVLVGMLLTFKLLEKYKIDNLRVKCKPNIIINAITEACNIVEKYDSRIINEKYVNIKDFFMKRYTKINNNKYANF